MTIRDLINQSVKKLIRTSDSAQLDAEVLLSHFLDKPKEYLLTNPEREIRPKLEKQFRILLNDRIEGWPVAYLQNQKEFHGRKFYVDKNVLIPRPETEGLVDLVLKNLPTANRKLKILDIGTGSGNIIISLAKNLRSSKFFASDISAKALAVAKKNAKSHQVKITFKQGSLLKPWGKQKFDVIVANLPYLAKQTDKSTKFEPKQALIAKNKGLALFEQLFQQISTLQPITCNIFLEIGHDQAQAIKKLATKWLPSLDSHFQKKTGPSRRGGPAFETKIYKDLFGRTRFALLKL